MSMVDALDDLTYDLEEDGTLVRRQLERVVLARGPWATVLFLYEELDHATGVFRAPRIAFVRFQKRRGAYRKHAAFTLAGANDARALEEVLARWRGRMDAAGEDEDAPDDGFDAGAFAQDGA
ncbi:MAG TPA: hypothetical protein VHJ20_05060 [Polyangia bacterium]|nr:hypothetical protein [Polyangia bacterium]